MKSKSLGLRVAGGIFGAIALMHGLRLIKRPQILIGGRPMPLWPSGLATAILVGLSAWMWGLACGSED